MEYYSMTRNGEFVPHKTTPNQCKVQGHPAYNYSVKMIFPMSVKLDEHGFVVDHTFIDKTIHALKLEGSCEEMHHVLCSAVRDLFEKAKIPLYGYKCSIIPDMRVGDAYMDYIYISEEITAMDSIRVASLLN